LAKIREFIYSKDGKIRSAKILLTNKNIITQAINHLFPLEINSHSQVSCEESAARLEQSSIDIRNISKRQAAAETRTRISKQLTENAACILFCFPPGVSQTCS